MRQSPIRDEPTLLHGEALRSSAILSQDKLYRYRLSRLWSDAAPATFVMFNPSTADAYVDDPTIRRCTSFARSWGCGGIVVVNLYGLRATVPDDLWRSADPVGPENDYHLREAVIRGAGPVVAAWGTRAKPDRVDKISTIADAYGVQLLALKVTKTGAPGHPLYLRADAKPFPWPVVP